MIHRCQRPAPQAGLQHQPSLPCAIRIVSRPAIRPNARCVSCAAINTGSGRQPRQIVQFRQRDGAEDVEQELEYLHLDFDCTELLDLHGRESYLLCDVTKAHEYLWTLPLTDGYSPDVIEGRRELLDSIKERALLQEGKVKQQDKGIDVPVQLLPSALALLAQINQNDAVYDLAAKLLDNWDMRKTYKRDIILSLAVARCNIARDLLADQKVADGCSVLEDALALLQSAGEPPLAPSLAADIQNAVDGFVVQRILDQLRGPMTPDAAGARRKAVAMLKDLLSKGSGPVVPRMLGGGFFASAAPAASENGSTSAESGLGSDAAVTADYIRLVVDCLTSQELVGMANWEQVARSTSSTTWLYPGLLQIAATAHIAVGFVDRRPATIKTAIALLRAVPASCEVLLLRGVANVLLGEPEAAVACIKEAASAPADAYISWPVDHHAIAGVANTGDEDEEPDLVAMTHLPPGPDAHAFLVSHSPDDPELLAGLCLYSEVFLSKVVFAGFPDTSQLQGAATSLPAYFDSPQVQQQLQEDKERSAGLAGSLTSVMDAVMSVQPLVKQFAESARSASTTLGDLGVQLRDGGRSKAPVANRLAADMGVVDGRPLSPEDDDHETACEQRPASAAGLVVEQVRGSAAAGVAAAQAAAANLSVGLQQAKGELEGRLGSKWPAAAAAAALAAVVAGVVLTRRGTVSAAAAPSQQSVVQRSNGAAAVKQLDKGQALKVVKHFQAAKAAALSSEFDTSKLADVCVGPALAQFNSMAEEWAAQGWFRTSDVWKIEIVKVAPRSSSGQRMAVTARIGETSSTWGVDGQQGTSWSNEYDVEYDVALCSDMQWRIQGLQVRGKEPGARGWFGIFGGSN